MEKLYRFWAIMLFLGLQTSVALCADTVKVGIKVAPPFTVQGDGNWDGLAFNLWEHIATQQGLVSEYHEMDMAELTTALKNSEIDVALGAITVSAERERDADFSPAFYPSGLGVMLRDEQPTALRIILNLISGTFIQVVGLLCLVLLLVGFLVWVAEKKRNSEEFEPGWKGVLSGFWWSAVTMTTVGYGDKAPKSGAGKTLALVWMFASLIMISYFTASIASALTVQRIGETIKTPSDLKKVAVGAIAGTVSEQYLKEHHIPHVAAATFDELVKMMEQNNIDAVMSDYPLIKYYLHSQQGHGKWKMLPHKFNEFFYALGYAEDFAMQEKLNLALLEYLESREWREQLASYFGLDE